MKREDVKNKIPGITDEQLDWLMGENGRDVTAERKKADGLQAQVDSLTTQVATAQDGLKAFGEHKPEDFAAAQQQIAQLQQQIAQLQQQMQAQADGFAFDHALDTAILGKQGRSVKAVRALLDVDALKGSKDLTADIAQALEAAAKANPWAFGEVQPSGYPAVRDGGEGGKTPTGSAREQFAAWAEQALK